MDLITQNALKIVEGQLNDIHTVAAIIIQNEVVRLANINNWDVFNTYNLTVYHRGTKDEVSDEESKQIEDLVFEFRNIFNVDMANFIYCNGEFSE